MKSSNRVRLGRAAWLIAAISFVCATASAEKNIGLQEQLQVTPATQGVSVPAALQQYFSPPVSAHRGGPGVCGNAILDDGETCDDGEAIPSNGDGCDEFCQIEVGSDCTLPIPGIDSANAVANGSFEDTTVWSLTGSAGLITFEGPDLFGFNLATDGTDHLLFRSSAAGASASLTQTIDIPSNATNLVFDWFGAFGTDGSPSCGSPDTILSISIDGTEVFASDPDLDCPAPTSPFWTFDETIDVTSFQGATGVVFEIEWVHGVTADGANFFLDNIRLESPLVPPIDPIPSSCLVGSCGDGILSSGEQCDDFNNDDLDGCSSACTVEELTHACFGGDTALGVLNGSLESVENIADGGLEDGSPNADWVEDGGPHEFEPICSELFCGSFNGNDGAFYAWFGGIAFDPADPENPGDNIQTLSQTVIIDSDATVLTFDLSTQCSSATDTLVVDIDGTPIYTHSCAATSLGFSTQTSDDISAFADGVTERTVTFTGTNTCSTFLTDPTCQSNFFVDNISISYDVSPDRDAVGATCNELPEVCDVEVVPSRGAVAGLEQFEAGIPTSWTAFASANADGDANVWGTTDDAVCGSAGNWGTGNVTGGSGNAACIDADAQVVPMDETRVMDAYLCTPELDLTNVTNPELFLTRNLQVATNDGTEIAEIVWGTQSPNQFSIVLYELLANDLDHASNSLELSAATVGSVDLTSLQTGSSVWVCFRYGAETAPIGWYWQLDNVGVRAQDCTVGPPDSDSDGIPDVTDNCIDVANGAPVLPGDPPSQRDTDGDGIGNACDADVDTIGDPGNCLVDFLDLLEYRANFFMPGDFDTDNNGDGITDFLDLLVVRSQFFMQPGPSATGCDTLP